MFRVITLTHRMLNLFSTNLRVPRDTYEASEAKECVDSVGFRARPVLEECWHSLLPPSGVLTMYSPSTVHYYRWGTHPTLGECVPMVTAGRDIRETNSDQLAVQRRRHAPPQGLISRARLRLVGRSF